MSTKETELKVPYGFEGFQPGPGMVAIYFPVTPASKSGLTISEQTAHELRTENAKKDKEKELRVFAVGEDVKNIPIGVSVMLEPRVWQRPDAFLESKTANEGKEDPSACILVRPHEILGWFNNNE